MSLLGAALLTLVQASAPTAAPIASGEITRSGKSWTASYTLAEDAPVWVFPKSDLPRVSRRSWRIETVRVETPGVRLARLGHYDALVGTEGRPVPRNVRLSFRPYPDDIESGYDPALVFSDGSVALYTTAFKLVPARSTAEVAAAPIDDSKLPQVGRVTNVRFHDGGRPLMARGEQSDEVVVDDLDAYVLFGTLKPTIGPAMTTVLDPGLPRWLSDYLEGQLPKVLATYQQKFGPAPVGKPLLMVSWAGTDKEDGVSLSGSVLTGTVVMTIGGKQTLSPNERLRQYVSWFVSHEAAHFWLGQAVEYGNSEESWITEGGADLLAFRATAAADPLFDIATRLGEARAECLPFLKKGGIAGAKNRGDFRAYYACGALIALVAERSAGGDFAVFVRDLIADEGRDQTITRAEWLAAVERRLPGLGLSAAIDTLLDQGAADPGSAINDLLRRAGVTQPIKVPTKQ